MPSSRSKSTSDGNQNSQNATDEDEVLSSHYLSVSSLSKGELVKRLKKLSTFLSKVEQDTTETKDINTCAAALIQEAIINHKEKDVRIFAACCLSDIIRIFAPEAPYNNTQLPSIFQLFIDELSHLSDKDDPLYQRYIYLLERLVLVKAFVLLVEISPAMISQLFDALFNAISENHPSSVRTHFLDIMISCLEETPNVTGELLTVILTYLVSPKKAENPAAFRLAQSLTKRFTNLLQPSITQFLLELRDSDSELKEKFHELIFELYRISPSLIVKILPTIEEELKIDDQTGRSRSIYLLHYMFSSKGSTLASSYHPLFLAFLARFQDKEVDLRLKMIEFGKTYLINHQAYASDVAQALQTRLLDPEAKVRQVVVAAICDVAQENPASVSEELLRDVGNRLQDKKENVRKVAIHKLCALYSHAAKSADTDLGKLEWIPSNICKCYYLPEAQDRFRVEKGLEMLITGDLGQQTARFIIMYNKFDGTARAAFLKLLKEKKSFQQEFAEFMQLRTSNADSEELTKKISSLSSKFPDPDKAREDLHKLSTAKDNSIFKQLSILGDVDAKYSAIKTAKTEAGKKLEAKKLYYGKKLIRKLSMFQFLNKESVSIIFDKMQSSKKENANTPKLLEDLSGVYPAFFTSALEDLPHLFEKRELADFALLILTNTGTLLQETNPALSKSIQEKLYTFCVEGTPSQAKCAIKAIHKLYGQRSNKILSGLLKDLLSLLDLKEKKIETALKSLGHLAELAPNVFEAGKPQFMEFLEDLLTKNRSAKKKSQDAPSSECDVKRLTLRVLVHYLCSTEHWQEGEEDNEHKLMFLLLIKALKTQGELTTQANTSEADKALIWLEAAGGILKLVRQQRYDKRVSPEQFELLASTIQEPPEDVRDRFAKKLFKGLQTLKLPVRYLSIFALAVATDSERKNAKHYLATNVKLRRDYMKTNETLYNKPALQSHFLPEYALPHLIHLLAHHPFFQQDKSQNFDFTFKCLNLFMEPLYQTNNYLFLTNLLNGIRLTKDATAPESRGIHVVAEIAFKLVMRKFGKQKRTELAPQAPLYLPPNLFQLPSESESLSWQLHQSALPPDFQLPPENQKKNILQTPTSKGQPSRTEEEDTEEKQSEQEERQQEEEEEQPLRSRKNKRAEPEKGLDKESSPPKKPKQKASDDKENQDNKGEKEKKVAKKIEKKRKAKGKKKEEQEEEESAKVAVEEQDDLSSVEDEPTSQRNKKTSHKKKSKKSKK